MAEAAVDVVVMLGDEDVMAGRLWGHRRRGAESATFAYAPGYLRRADAYELDPSLPLLGGPLQTPAGRAMFGAFSDCAPDRWGRRLIGRAERERARRGGAAQRSFGELDYLIGVRDDLRQGALRFRDPVSGACLAVELTASRRLSSCPSSSTPPSGLTATRPRRKTCDCCCEAEARSVAPVPRRTC